MSVPARWQPFAGDSAGAAGRVASAGRRVGIQPVSGFWLGRQRSARVSTSGFLAGG